MLTMAYPCRLPVGAEDDDALGVVLCAQSTAKVSQEFGEGALGAHGGWEDGFGGLGSDEAGGAVAEEEGGDSVWGGGKGV